MKQFLEIKKDVLGRKDKSDIGCWDNHILPLCEKINKTKEYFTTSSCAGRIVLIISEEKKKSGLFLFRTHEKIKPSELKQELGKIKIKKLVYFKQEPCILHVACSSLESAQALLDKAKLAGWKNSGIMASSGKFILEMRSTEKIELPIYNKGKILVDDDYLKTLVLEANSRLERTWEKIQKLEKLIGN
jgi:tRNA wybutosine-synthesizing protein 3